MSTKKSEETNGKKYHVLLTELNSVSTSSSSLPRQSSNRHSKVKQQAKKNVMRKLYDPCIVCRYESMSYRHGDKDHEQCDDDPTNQKSPMEENRTFATLRMNQREATNLTRIPWKIRIGKSLDHLKQVPSTDLLDVIPPYPEWNFLSIRHDQNMNWAQRQLENGVKYAKEALLQQKRQTPSLQSQIYIRGQHEMEGNPSVSSLLQKAETCYKQGLDLIPHHIGLLTAYSALCINDNRLLKAKRMLLDVMSYVEESNKSSILSKKDEKTQNDQDESVLNDAKLYLKVVEKKINEGGDRHVVRNTSSFHEQGVSLIGPYRNSSGQRTGAEKLHLSNKAYQDALAERSMFGNVSNKNVTDVMVGRTNIDSANKAYEILYSPSTSGQSGTDEDDEESSSSTSREKQGGFKKKRKKSSKQKKRRKRRKDSTRHEESSDEEGISKRRKKNKKKKKRKHYDTDS